MQSAKVHLIPMNQFQKWFNEQLEWKFRRDIDKVLTSFRPMMLFYSQLTQECTNFITTITESSDPELISLKSNLDNILHLIESLIGIAECVDYYFVEQFCYASKECISNIFVHLHPFYHCKLIRDEYDVQSKIIINIKIYKKINFFIFIKK